MGKGVIDERHPSFIGTAALLASDYVHCAVEVADLIINAGHDVVEKPPFIMKRGGQKVIHINFYSAKVDRIYFPLEVVGDIANALWQMTERLQQQSNWDLVPFMKVRDRMRQSLEEAKGDASFPVKPQCVVAAVRAALSSRWYGVFG
ncbi:hypothetical protein EBT25_09245 [bacterium]|nr:hypothetical protein [bacterium]